MTIAIPTVSEELEEFLADNNQVRQLFDEQGNPRPEFGEFLRNYRDAWQRRDDGSISQQIDEQVQAAVADLLKRTGSAGPGRVDLGPRRRDTTVSASAPGAKAEGIFDTHGEFLQAVYHQRDRMENAADLTAKLGRLRDVQNSFGTTIPSDGGFLVPESMRSEITTRALESEIVRPYATVIPMTTQKVSIPAVDDTTHASDTVFGGVACYWEGEAATMTDTDADFAVVSLEANWLTALATVPNNLPEDAPAFLEWFMLRMPQALGWKRDVSYLDGNGAGMPLGALAAGNPAIISVTKETSQTADTIVWENIIKVYSRMLPTSLGRAVWIANIDTLPELATMAQVVGAGGVPVWLSTASAAPPMTLLGRPLIFTEKVPKLGDAGDINFVDLSYYGIGDRRTMRLDSSAHSKFTSNQTQYRLTERSDGRPLLLSALTPRKSSSTLSAFVRIAARP